MDEDDNVARAMVEVGLRVAELRRRAGLTQAQVAERLETTTPNYVRIENGQNLTLRTIVRLALVFGVTRHEILTPPTEPDREKRVGRPRKLR